MTRAVEALAVAAGMAGAACVPLMAAWIVAGGHPAWATAMALLPLALVVLVWPAGLPGRVGQRWGIARPWRRVVVILIACASLAVVTAIRTQLLADVPHGLIPLVLIPLAGVSAWVTVLACGAPLRQAALYLDIRANLGERLITALELDQGAIASEFAQAVQTQAAEAVRRIRPRQLTFWTRTRATVGVLGLTLLACAILAAVPAMESPELAARRHWQRVSQHMSAGLESQAQELRKQAGQPAGQSLSLQAQQLAGLGAQLRAMAISPSQAMAELNRAQDELRRARDRREALQQTLVRLNAPGPTQSLARSAEDPAGQPRQAARLLAQQMQDGTMDQARRLALAATLAQAAHQAGGDPALASALADAAGAAGRNEAVAFQAALDRAATAMEAARSDTPSPAILASAMNAIEQSKDELGGEEDRPAAAAPQPIHPPSPAPSVLPEAPWHSVYVPPSLAAGAWTTTDGRSPSPTTAPSVPYDAAWSAARQRAEQAITRQKIPARYRQLIREYFGAE